jgi:hypothetical protein
MRISVGPGVVVSSSRQLSPYIEAVLTRGPLCFCKPCVEFGQMDVIDRVELPVCRVSRSSSDMSEMRLVRILVVGHSPGSHQSLTLAQCSVVRALRDLSWVILSHAKRYATLPDIRELRSYIG